MSVRLCPFPIRKKTLVLIGLISKAYFSMYLLYLIFLDVLRNTVLGKAMYQLILKQTVNINQYLSTLSEFFSKLFINKDKLSINGADVQ